MVVRFLLDNGLRVSDPSERSRLLDVIHDTDDDPSLVEDFIEAGANVTNTDMNGYTLLHSVAHGSFAEILVADGADISARTPRGLTPLHTACNHASLSVTKPSLTYMMLSQKKVNGRHSFSHRVSPVGIASPRL